MLSLRIKAQYIIYLAVGLVSLLLTFAILYVTGISIYLCLGIIIPAGAGLMTGIRHFSNKYGEHGLKRKIAEKSLPSIIRSSSKKVFIELKSEEKDEEEQKPERHIAGL